MKPPKITISLKFDGGDEYVSKLSTDGCIGCAFRNTSALSGPCSVAPCGASLGSSDGDRYRVIFVPVEPQQ